MIDKKFFKNLGPFSVHEIKKICGCEIMHDKDNLMITEIVNESEAQHDHLTFLHNSKYTESIRFSKAAACLVKSENTKLLPTNMIPIVVENPYYSLAVLLKKFYQPLNETCQPEQFVSKKASIAHNAAIGENSFVSDFVSIGNETKIGSNVFIEPGVVIGWGVVIGDNSYIESNVSISFSIIGSNTRIKSGAKIGQQGFGFVMGKNNLTDVPQLGKVIIGDNVVIGSNTTIDRGSMTDTKIGNNVRIDNLVHIAHNVEIGDFSVIAAQTGIAGSTKIGAGCALGGQCGIAGHLSIGNEVKIAAQSGIMRNITNKAKVGGSPAVDIVSWQRQNVLLKQIVQNRRLLFSK